MPSYSIVELAEIIDAKIIGSSDCAITSVSSLTLAKENQLSYIISDKYKCDLQTTKASVVIVPEGLQDFCSMPVLVSEHPELSFAKVAKLFLPAVSVPEKSIAASAVVAASACVADTAIVGANCVIGEDVIIGANTIVHPGVVIGDRCKIGSGCVFNSNVTLYHDVIIADRVVLHSGVVLGADGFGNVLHKGTWHPMPQLGGVVIGSDVTIGANTTIDRGALTDTIIEQGVKLDNLIQIGHNVRIGAHTAIAACVGIAGSTVIGKHCMIGGGCGIADHLTIADGVMLTGMSGVMQSIESPGIYSSGTGLFDNKAWRRTLVRFKQLNSLFKRIKLLEKRQDEF